MAESINKFIQGYNYLFDELPDPRTKDWLFVAKPYQILLLLFIYLIFVLKWGPKWMQKRPAFDLDKIIIVYNVVQIVACAYLFIEGVRLAWGWDYKWLCEPVDYSYSPRALTIARITYYYYLLKIMDLLDTVFFILRKKFNQITFLHIYHHTGMVLIIGAAATYFPGGHGTFIGVLNCFVHVIMYSYYLLTIINPSYKESCWWKKHITQLQIIQFFWYVVHMGAIVFKPDCEYPRWTSAVFLPQNIFMLILFLDFYVKTYVRKPILKQPKTSDANDTKYLKNNNETTTDNHSLNKCINSNLKNANDNDDSLEIIHEHDGDINMSDKCISEKDNGHEHFSEYHLLRKIELSNKFKKIQ